MVLLTWHRQMSITVWNILLFFLFTVWISLLIESDWQILMLELVTNWERNLLLWSITCALMILLYIFGVAVNKIDCNAKRISLHSFLIRWSYSGCLVLLQRMGNIDAAVPFFGKGFNRIYPLFMVVYTILVASNFFDRIINFFGSWKRFLVRTEADDTDGFDPSGMIILQKGG